MLGALPWRAAAPLPRDPAEMLGAAPLLRDPAEMPGLYLVGGLPAYAKAYCAQYLACYTGVMRERLGDLNTCEPAWRCHCESRMVSPGSSATAADLTICAAAISAQDCSEWFVNVPVECYVARTLSGRLPLRVRSAVRLYTVRPSVRELVRHVYTESEPWRPVRPLLRDCERDLVCGAGVGCNGSLRTAEPAAGLLT